MKFYEVSGQGKDNFGAVGTAAHREGTGVKREVRSLRGDYPQGSAAAGG